MRHRSLPGMGECCSLQAALYAISAGCQAQQAYSAACADLKTSRMHCTAGSTVSHWLSSRQRVRCMMVIVICRGTAETCWRGWAAHGLRAGVGGGREHAITTCANNDRALCKALHCCDASKHQCAVGEKKGHMRALHLYGIGEEVQGVPGVQPAQTIGQQSAGLQQQEGAHGRQGHHMCHQLGLAAEWMIGGKVADGRGHGSEVACTACC